MLQQLSPIEIFTKRTGQKIAKIEYLFLNGLNYHVA